MENFKFYKVAEHVFSVRVLSSVLEDCGLFGMMKNYDPFLLDVNFCDETVPRIFALDVVGSAEFEDFQEDTAQEEEGQRIACGQTADGLPVFVFNEFGQDVGQLICSKDFTQGRLLLKKQEPHMMTYGLNNSLMVLFALSTANLDTALFHGAVVGNDGKGYMFLGKSGTGKSTHARLWLHHIEGSFLLNDDNPVVRVYGDVARIYGSPWSGKTPCYRNESLPLGGMVLLSQAPYNKIVRLQGVQAFAALVPGISGMRWDRKIADGLFRTENLLAKFTPVWYLECLPDEDAARLCFEQIAKN